MKIKKGRLSFSGEVLGVENDSLLDTIGLR